MKRIILLVTAALVMALMLAVAGSALATVHPLANSECANENASDVATGQNPPGLSGQSNTDNFAQPVIAASGGDPFTEEGEEPPSPAFKTSGPTVADLDEDFCPTDE
jgi:hypothetical protein